MIVKVEFNSQDVKDRLGRLQLAQLEASKRGMVRITTEIRNRAKRRLRVRKGPGIGLGGRKTGRLSSSIINTVTLSETAVVGEVVAGTEYAKYVEGWNKAGEHIPAVNMANSYTPFIEPALKEVLPDAADILAAEVRVGNG